MITPSAAEIRSNILKNGVRAAGRSLTQIRPLSCEVGLLPRVHGSGLFTRGETQALTITTLGTMRDEQQLDGLGIADTKRFMHHYNFPPFSTGETKRVGTPGRREIGHGALAERALSPVIPPEAEFPYTIRLVSEIHELQRLDLHGQRLRLHAVADGRRHSHQGAGGRHFDGPGHRRERRVRRADRHRGHGRQLRRHGL